MLLGLLTAWTLAGPAGGHPIEIEWDAPAACPDGVWARGEIERFVGASLVETRATQLRFQVSISGDADEGWTAKIVTVTDGGKGRRRLTNSNCKSLSLTAALIVALVIDPTAIEGLDDEDLEALQGGMVEDSGTGLRGDADGEGEGEGEGETETEGEGETENENETETEAGGDGRGRSPAGRRRRLQPWWGGVRAVFDLGVGRLPTIDLGGTVGVTVGGGPLRIEVLGGAWAPRAVTIEGDARAQFYAWGVGARIGGAIPIRRIVEIPILAGFDVGRIRASGRGLSAASEAAPVLAHAHLVPGVTVWVHRNVGLLVEADVFVPFVRPTFSVGGRGSVYQALPVGVHGGLGLIVRGPARDNGSRGKRKQ